MINLISDNAIPQRKIEIEENKLLNEAKKFFKWRKIDIQRVKKLGSTDYDKLIEYLYQKGY